MAEAQRRGVDLAAFLIHEFQTAEWSEGIAKSNARHLNSFLVALTEDDTQEIRPGEIVGPFAAPGNEWIPKDLPLLVAKLRTVVRTS